MSFVATLWAWKQSGISATQKIVLLDICDRANAGNQCWPKQKTIAARVHLTERAVCTALAVLQQKKLIRRQPRIKFGKRTSDLITISVSDKPGPKPTGGETPPNPPKQPDVNTRFPSEHASGHRQNAVPPAGRTPFGVISLTEPHRSNLPLLSSLIELMPEPGRPDIDNHNGIVRFLAGLRRQIDADIDRSSPGIENARLVIDWLSRHGANAVEGTIMATVARRRQNRRSGKIGSWAYFEPEIAKLEAVGAAADNSRGLAEATLS